MELLTSKEAAEFLKISRHTLEAWRCKGEGPPFMRAGRLARYDKEELERWLKSRTEKGLRKEDNKLSNVEAAALLGIHHTSLARWRVQGKGPEYEKVNARKVVYDRHVVEAWKRKHENEDK